MMFVASLRQPHSSEPLHEVEIYDLLKSLSSYLEWTWQLSQKSVLNKILRFRVFYLKEAREVVLPFSDNKLFDWIKKYQVGRAAKSSKTIFKILQKEKTTLLFRDVAIGVMKEVCKR